MHRSTPLKTVRLLAFACACTVLLLSAAPARAGQSVPGSIRVVAENWPPYSFMDKDRVSGAMTEVLQAALQQAGIAGEIKIMEWSKAFSIARTEKNVLVYPILRQAEREKRFAWIGPVMEAPLEYMLFRAKKKKVQVDSVDDVKKLRTAVMLSDALGAVMRKEGFSHRTNMLSCTTEAECIRAVLTGRADLYARPADQGAEPPGKMALVRDFDLPDAWLYAAFSFNTPELTVRRVQTGLDLVLQDGTVTRILEKYHLK